MDLQLRRIILFTPNLAAMIAFYRDIIGLKPLGREKGWADFDAGACRLALHAGPSQIGKRPPKLAFFAAAVASARARLIKRGARFGPVKSLAHFEMCDGEDPDGNPISLSSRR